MSKTKRKRSGSATGPRDYAAETVWTPADLAHRDEIAKRETRLPADAPRALLSVRLSVFTDESTSVVRQELDLREQAVNEGFRVIGVASDVNQSATKVPPWKRKELGKWLTERQPEFDVLMFWKLDRFVRNMNDLSAMIRWAAKYEKNLYSKLEKIDLESVAGKIMVQVLGGVAEIESLNTKVRVESLWQYNKGQDEWLIGRPPFGYHTVRGDDGAVRLQIYEPEAKALRIARALVMRGWSVTAVTKLLNERGIIQSNTTMMFRRLRNPACMGYRVEVDPNFSKNKIGRLVLGRDGQPIRLAPGIFTQEQFDSMQVKLDSRTNSRNVRNPDSPSRFLGIIKCADCGTNISCQRMTKADKTYLRCTGCKSGGPGYNDPHGVYARIAQTVLREIGDEPVRTREYARGEENRKKVEQLQAQVAHYMAGTAPGGIFTGNAFMLEQANATLATLAAELSAVDQSTTEDRWVYTAGSKTFREHWEEGGYEAMAADLARVGVRITLHRIREEGKRAIEVELDYDFPKDIRERLVVRDDDFTADF